jgi:hypothetical protein
MAGNEEKMIACCGLICTDCPSFIATKAGDADKIAEIALQWSKEFKAEIQTESVWCDGCIVGGRKCGHCGECEVRACVMSKELENCGWCGELGSCDKIQGFFKLAAHAKPVIEEIAKSREM